MKLRLVGHDYKYAVEQIMLSLFPEQRPDYTSDTTIDQGNLSAESRLSTGAVYAQAVTIMHCGDKVSRGTARVRLDKMTGKLIADRLKQRIIKQSFYRSALGFIDTPPVWGSLTGIRPAKIAASALRAGMKDESAKKMIGREYCVSPERAAMCVRAAQASINLERTLETGDISLYIGIPFCPTRCAYCSFVSNSVEKSFDLIEPFVQTLMHEIGAAAKMANTLGLRVVSVYIGGGTPTALPAETLGAIMMALCSSFNFSHIREYTVEAGRPDTVTPQKLEIIRRYGAGRVCINPQTMSNEVLLAIGRSHSPEDALDAARLVRQSGAELNMDVIAGLPGDTPEGFRLTLDTILGLCPENVTVHTLSLKKGSRIMHENPELPGAKDVAKMLDYASLRLQESGFGPYYLYRQKFTSGGFENTGWSLPGHEGIYNICMMEELCTVLALGGGGVTKLVSPNGRIERIFNAKYPLEYIRQAEKIPEKFEKASLFIENEF